MFIQQGPDIPLYLCGKEVKIRRVNRAHPTELGTPLQAFATICQEYSSRGGSNVKLPSHVLTQSDVHIFPRLEVAGS